MIESMTAVWPGLLALSDGAPAAAAAAAPLWSVASLISLATLASLEIVLGIDNVIFIAILSGRLPQEQQPKARQLGIAMAVISRLALLLAISWVMGLTQPLIYIASFGISGKQLILLLGGLFLIGKATYEIHDKLEGDEDEHGPGGGKAGASFVGVIAQIAADRHRVLARLGDHRGRHDAARADHDGRRRDRGGRDADLRRPRSATSSTSTRP